MVSRLVRLFFSVSLTYLFLTSPKPPGKYKPSCLGHCAFSTLKQKKKKKFSKTFWNPRLLAKE